MAEKKGEVRRPRAAALSTGAGTPSPTATAQLQDKIERNESEPTTDIRHRKETFYREGSTEADSAVSSAPPSLSPQPYADLMTCAGCAGSEARAAAAARECARLGHALRDARDQLELLEFRLLELEDSPPHQGGVGSGEALTDSDSGCVSPGSRIKDSASPELRGGPAPPCAPPHGPPELRRTDSGYKSPGPSASPAAARRHHHTRTDQEEACAVSLLQSVGTRAQCSADRRAVQTCLRLLGYLPVTSPVASPCASDDEDCQIKLGNGSRLKYSKSDADLSRNHKAIATVSPYSQQTSRDKFESIDSACSDEPKKISALQESGIFEEVETESRATQTDDGCENGSDLHAEIQRLNSIREKLEKQKTKVKDDNEGLECKCVKLGEKHKQYYERRLKFLEGKISIYEAAPLVKESKLAQRLQKEYMLENKIQELEMQLVTLNERYDQLESDYCELEEIENDTRLHWQQLEIDYELCSAQLRDVCEGREHSKIEVERLLAQVGQREVELTHREKSLSLHLQQLEQIIPVLIVFNVAQILKRRGLLNLQETDVKECQLVPVSPAHQRRLPSWQQCTTASAATAATAVAATANIQLVERLNLEKDAALAALGQEVETRLQQLAAAVAALQHSSRERLDLLVPRLARLQTLVTKMKAPALAECRVESVSQLRSRVEELEARETAYLQMLTQADDMWAEMEGGYKRRIEDAQRREELLTAQVRELEGRCGCGAGGRGGCAGREADALQALRQSADKAQRDARELAAAHSALQQRAAHADASLAALHDHLASLTAKHQKESMEARAALAALGAEAEGERRAARSQERELRRELERAQRALVRARRHHQDLDVTNAELREEVESLESQLAIMQKAITQCKRSCDEKIRTMSHELSIKTEELEEMRSESLNQCLKNARLELPQDKTEYEDEGCGIYKAVPRKIDYGRMHHSLSYITTGTRCSCPGMRSQLIGSLIEDLFERIHNTADEDLEKLCKDLAPNGKDFDYNDDTKVKIANYLLMAISKELVRSIGDADKKTETEEWQRAAAGAGGAAGAASVEGEEAGAGVVRGAARLASVACACAAARLAAAAPALALHLHNQQQEVLEHNDVKVMEEQLASAIESIVNCPSCALGSHALVWSTDV